MDSESNSDEISEEVPAPVQQPQEQPQPAPLLRKKKEEKKEETVLKISYLTQPADYVSVCVQAFDAGFKAISEVPSIEYKVLQNINNHEETKIATPNLQEEKIVQ